MIALPGMVKKFDDMFCFLFTQLTAYDCNRQSAAVAVDNACIPLIHCV